MRRDSYPCVGATHGSHHEATVARVAAELETGQMHEVYVCVEGHWHQREVRRP